MRWVIRTWIVYNSKDSRNVDSSDLPSSVVLPPLDSDHWQWYNCNYARNQWLGHGCGHCGGWRSGVRKVDCGEGLQTGSKKKKKKEEKGRKKMVAFVLFLGTTFSRQVALSHGKCFIFGSSEKFRTFLLSFFCRLFLPSILFCLVFVPSAFYAVCISSTGEIIQK